MSDQNFKHSVVGNKKIFEKNSEEDIKGKRREKYTLMSLTSIYQIMIDVKADRTKRPVQ